MRPPHGCSPAQGRQPVLTAVQLDYNVTESLWLFTALSSGEANGHVGVGWRGVKLRS